VEAIAEYLQEHAGLHFSLGLVEMPIYLMQSHNVASHNHRFGGAHAAQPNYPTCGCRIMGLPQEGV
jgi:hypothetical protein